MSTFSLLLHIAGGLLSRTLCVLDGAYKPHNKKPGVSPSYVIIILLENINLSLYAVQASAYLLLYTSSLKDNPRQQRNQILI